MPHLNGTVACDPWCKLAELIVTGWLYNYACSTIVCFGNSTTKTGEIDKVAMANQKNRGQHIHINKRQFHAEVLISSFKL